MNTKGMKFLAVLTVLAMAFAAFAVIGDFETADAAPAQTCDPVPMGDYALVGPTGTTITVSGTTASFAGVFDSNVVYDAETDETVHTAALMASANAYVFAMVGLNVPATGEEYDLKIVQKNSALKVAFPDGYTDGTSAWGSSGTKVVAGSDVMTKYYANAVFKDGNTLDIMVPLDGSSVTLEITKYKIADESTTVSTITLDFSKAYTKVVLGANIDEGTFAWNGTKLTLTDYNGNAVFKGAIQQVILSGENIIEASGVDYAIWSTYDGVETVKIKPVVGQGSLAIALDDKVDVTALSFEDANLAIEATDVAIVIDTYDADNYKEVTAINTDNFSIYESTLEIELDTDNEYGCALNIYSMDMKSCVYVSIESYFGIDSGNVDIAASNVVVEATYAIDADVLTVTTNSSVTFNSADLVDGIAVYGSTIEAIDIESESTVTTNNLKLFGGVTDSTNSATVFVNGNLIIEDSAVLVNKSDFDVAKNVIVIGALNNQGSFDVAGKMTISGVKDKFTVTNAIAGATQETTDDYITAVDIMSLRLIADGNAVALVKFTTHDEVVLLGFAMVSLDKDGKLLGLEANELGDITVDPLHPVETDMSVTVTWIETTTPAAKQYDISVTGNDLDIDDSSKDMDAKVAVCAANDVASDGVLTVSAGTLTVTGGIIVNKAQAANFTKDTGAIVADITANAGIVTDKGAIGGNITTYADLTIGADLIGNITVSAAERTIAIDGSMLGNVITSKDATEVVIGGTLYGNVEVTNADVSITKATNGVFKGDVTLSGKYKPVAEGDDVDYSASATADIEKTVGGGVTINTKKAVNPAPGFIYVEDDLKAPAENKVAKLTALTGELKFTNDVTIENGFGFSAAAGATVTVLKNKTVTINGAIIADENAIFNYKAIDKAYGAITNEIVFTVSPNTYYCSFEYAIDNAPEGTLLVLTASPADIENAVTIKDGVIIVLEENVVVTFLTKSVTMGEGAGFMLSDGSKVVFGTAAENQKVNANFVYGDNEVVLKDVVFTAGADNTVVAVKGNSTTADRIGLKVNGYNAGSIELVSGEFNQFEAAVTFVNTDGNKSSGEFIIDAGAKYVGAFATSSKAKIEINGVYAPAAAANFEIAIKGTGSIVLGDTISATFATSADGKTKQNIIITDGTSSILLKDAFVKTTPIVFTAHKEVGTVPAYIGLTGADAELNGTYTINGNVTFADNMTSVEKTVIIAETDSVVSIAATKELIIAGLFKVAGTLNVETEDDNSYGTIGVNLITYTDGVYTVYAPLDAAITEGGVKDFTVSENIALTGGATPETAKNLGDVTITVASGKTLTINNYVVIGSASKTLGAAYGIEGKIKLGVGAVLVVYEDATVDADNIFQNDGETKAVSSQFIVDYNDALYATVYNDGTVLLTNVEKSLNPSFDGYKFTGYSNYVPLPAAEQVVGATDVAIMLEAGKVSVVLAKVDGMTYYVNNVAYKQMGVPVELKVGDVVSASVNSGYTGTAKVNGQDYIIVDAATKTITATGAQPVPTPEPTPEPSSNDFGITEILLIVLVIMIAVLIVVMVLRLNRS